MGESIADDDRRISRRGGDNVCVVVVKVKNMGRGGLVALVINHEVNSLAPHSERRVRLLPWAHGSALSSSSSCSDPGFSACSGGGREENPRVVRGESIADKISCQ